MIRLKIDHIEIEVAKGTTVLEAAREAGIRIPSMCYLKGYDNHPSCMVCLVKDNATGNMMPSCSLKAEEGMDIAASEDDVVIARRQALELLMSDHAGDCEAPCSLACPAGMEIPLMNRLIAERRFTEALSVVKKDIALPYILGYICPAPCEKACRRKQIDDAVSICLLKRFTATKSDITIKPDRFQKPVRFSPEKRIAIIGSGPAGLAAAYYTVICGNSCDVFEKSEQPGGTLRYAIPEEELPREVIDNEIGLLISRGVNFHCNTIVTEKFFSESISDHYAAVIIATGEGDQLVSLVETGKLNLKDANPAGFKNPSGLNIGTPAPGIFVCGSAVRPHKMAVRSVAQGKTAAMAANEYVHGRLFQRPARMFNSRFDRLFESEYNEYLKESTASGRIKPAGKEGFSEEEAINEALRCMHCDCRKKDNCRLRIYADEYKVDRKRYLTGERKAMTKQVQHNLVVYEPEKCIKCGLCVVISVEKEQFGLAFEGRGFDVTIKTPLGQAFNESLTHTAELCASSCPTGALSLKDSKNRMQ